jgi:hypothetical protein
MHGGLECGGNGSSLVLVFALTSATHHTHTVNKMRLSPPKWQRTILCDYYPRISVLSSVKLVSTWRNISRENTMYISHKLC